MQANALTFALVGLEAHPIRVEVDSSRGPTGFHLVGLADAAVRESRVRVRAALSQLDIDMDDYAITVSLAPADLRKSSGALDLAIAVATLASMGELPASAASQTAFFGELSLTGAIRGVPGVLPALLGAAARGVAKAIVPRENGREAALVPQLEVLLADDLREVVAHLSKGHALRSPPAVETCVRAATVGSADLADVRGQHGARRAVELAAAGAHNLIMMGPPGSGKTMLAKRLPTVLPPMTMEEAIEVTAIHSVAGLLRAEQGVIGARPFRSPHHTVSPVGLAGGGDPIRPGEVSLAHHGCLFLDELLELRRGAIESLRQPLEDGTITICRARMRTTFPARPLLVAAVNPCPCGYEGDRSRRCTCTFERVRAYRARMSGPLLDRIDLHVMLPPVDIAEMQRGKQGESSARVRERVVRARAAQTERHRRGEVDAATNAALSSRSLARVATPDEAGTRVLFAAVEKLGLSARAYDKVLRVARTAADLEGSDAVRAAHVAEAVQARILDRETGARASAPTPDAA